jgi:hypothetical protein
VCKEFESFASRNGLTNGGIEHCYTCGTERPTNWFKDKDIEYLVSASKAHWRKYPIIPYNWHLLEEEKRWAILWSKTK